MDGSLLIGTVIAVVIFVWAASIYLDGEKKRRDRDADHSSE